MILEWNVQGFDNVKKDVFKYFEANFKYSNMGRLRLTHLDFRKIDF